MTMMGERAENDLIAWATYACVEAIIDSSKMGDNDGFEIAKARMNVYHTVMNTIASWNNSDEFAAQRIMYRIEREIEREVDIMDYMFGY